VKEVLVKEVEKVVSTAEVTTSGIKVTTASVEVSTSSPTEAIIADELTLAQTLIEIGSAKPKVKGKEENTLQPKEQKGKGPPTRAQQRSIMSTYLKNIAGYKHNQLKNKSFDDIQKLFDKAMKRVNIFVDMDIELVEGSEVRVEAEIAQESSSKRACTELEQESIKKQKVDEYKETAEL
ncbi:hypothetical protein Tco_0130709, partial [Tanacetum coccineum]